MITLDTNVLVRYLVSDHESQAEAARVLLDTLTVDRPAFVCREVMVELVWVLERAYGRSAGDIARVVLELLATEALVVEAAADVAYAALGYRAREADFADLMILAAARRHRALPVYTFDRGASRGDGVVLLTS